MSLLKDSLQKLLGAETELLHYQEKPTLTMLLHLKEQKNSKSLFSYSTLSWEQWFKKYWLIAPINTAIFGIKLYMMYKGVLERPAHHADIPATAA